MTLRSDKTWNSTPIPDRVKFRAANKWIADGDCRISTYSVGSHGYAQIGWGEDGKNHIVLAHRAAWEFHMGPVPIGYTLDHQCKVKKCINPAHLRILPNFENARRTDGRDWALGQCVNGHPNSELREYSRGPGLPKRKRCSVCNGDYQRRYRAKLKAA